jgi:hypothetical protein
VHRGWVAGGYAWPMTDNGPGVVRVRAARPDEAEVLVGIQQAASVAAFGHLFPPARYPFPVGPVGERWRAALGAAEGGVLVAEREGLAVGVVQVAPERLDGLFVLPWAWGAAGWLTGCTTRPSRRCVGGAVATAGCWCLRRTLAPAASMSVVAGGWTGGGHRPRSRRTRRWSATPSP